MHTKVLLLGDPRLRMEASPVAFPLNNELIKETEVLAEALEEFRHEKGFGRAIAAPQIGIPGRFIAFNLDGKPFTVFNPVITWHSMETFRLWDDCMSFPDLLVKVERYASISVAYQDEQGRPCVLERLDRSRSELFQHEMDHLDGILAIDRAMDRESIVYRSVFEDGRDSFLEQLR